MSRSSWVGDKPVHGGFTDSAPQEADTSLGKTQPDVYEREQIAGVNLARKEAQIRALTTKVENQRTELRRRDTLQQGEAKPDNLWRVHRADSGIKFDGPEFAMTEAGAINLCGNILLVLGKNQGLACLYEWLSERAEVTEARKGRSF